MFLIFCLLLISTTTFSQTHSLLELKQKDFLSLDAKPVVSDSIDISKIAFAEKDLNYPVIIGLGAVVTVTTATIYTYQRQAWWSDARSQFHFANDWDYAMWIDKVGHFYDGVLLQHGISAAFEAANIEYEKSQIYGTLGSFLFMTYVEIEDGFGPNWGFSPGDGVANTLGALYPLAQYYYPYLKNFQFRFSYYPENLHNPGLNPGQEHIIFDDYEGQKFWLSFRIKEMLPENITKHIPSFLTFSVGTGVKNLDGSGGGRRDYYLAFDVDFEAIPLYGSGWQFVKNTLNFLHCPMPGIRINKDGVTFFALLF